MLEMAHILLKSIVWLAANQAALSAAAPRCEMFHGRHQETCLPVRFRETAKIQLCARLHMSQTWNIFTHETVKCII